jgi:hypothetical protein
MALLLSSLTAVLLFIREREKRRDLDMVRVVQDWNCVFEYVALCGVVVLFVKYKSQIVMLLLT